MRKIFKKAIAAVAATAMVATLLVGINVSKEVKADDTPVTLANWSFMQGGQFNTAELWNVAYITSVKMSGTDEMITDWKQGAGSVQQTIAAQDISDGFEMVIDRNSNDRDWGNKRFNPWAITATMPEVAIEAGHIYTVSFKAHANARKYCYVAFGSDIEGTGPYGDAELEGDKNLIAFDTTDKEFTYTFTNWASAKTMNIQLMLGAFAEQFDFAGNDVSDIILAPETMWSGTVYVSDFTITDAGKNPNFVDLPEKQTTTAPSVDPTKPTTPAATQPTTQAKPEVKALAKVTKVKAKNSKKRSLTISWKKVVNAKSYQVKVGKKTYNVKKVKFTAKKLKVGKKYAVKVRAKAAGFKTGAWSKAVKVKVKK